MMITVDTPFSRSGASFKNCQFIFENFGSLSLDNCQLEFCDFIGFQNSANLPDSQGDLIINRPTLFSNNNFSKYFRYIIISNGDVQNFIDKSISVKINLSSLKFYNFR